MPFSLKINTSFKAALALLSCRKRTTTNVTAPEKSSATIENNDVSGQISLAQDTRSDPSVNEIEKLINQKAEENFPYSTLSNNSEDMFGLTSFDTMKHPSDGIINYLNHSEASDSCSLSSATTLNYGESNFFSSSCDSQSSSSSLASQVESYKEDESDSSSFTTSTLSSMTTLRGATAPPKSGLSLSLGDLINYEPCQYTSQFDKPSQVMYQSLDTIKEESELYISLFSLSERSRKLQSQFLFSLNEDESE